MFYTQIERRTHTARTLSGDWLAGRNHRLVGRQDLDSDQTLYSHWEELCRSQQETGKGGGSMQQLSGHVAIVDDDTSTRVALARLLAVHKIDCRTYPSARAFLAALPSATPVCLIVDVNMPETTGLDLLRELLRLGVHIPTIVITAIDDESVAANATSLGAEAFLTKPLSREALMVAINSGTKKWN